MQIKNISATTKFSLTQGGRYLVSFHSASWSAGTAQIERLAADGVTYVPVPVSGQYVGATSNPTTVVTADGALLMDLPAGSYQVALSGSVTGLYVEVALALAR